MEVKNLPFEQWWNIRKMVLGKSLTSQALRPTKTPDLLKTEEAHQWKLWVEEERRKNPPPGRKTTGFCGKRWEGVTQKNLGTSFGVLVSKGTAWKALTGPDPPCYDIILNTFRIIMCFSGFCGWSKWAVCQISASSCWKMKINIFQEGLDKLKLCNTI